MKDRTIRLTIGVLLGVWLCGSARADLAGCVDDIISQSLSQQVHFSIRIVEAGSGRALYEHDARELMIPASNMKLVTTAAALEYLGPSYQYRTKVGLCDGNLVVIGSGDPLLGDERNDAKHARERDWIFTKIVAALKSEGVQEVNDIIVDTTVFDDERVHPRWPGEQLNQWYACEVSGLNFNDNCIDVTAKKVEGRVVISIYPQTTFIEAVNKVIPSSGSGNAVGAYRTREPNKIIFRGECKGDVGPFPVAIERPGAFFGFLLAENLTKAGVRTKGHLVEKGFQDSGDFKLLVEHATPIADCLGRCNKNSLGLGAEALLKTLAANSRQDGKGGSWERGREVVSWYLQGLGLDRSQFYIDDGSGLSRQNELTAYAITTVLLDLYDSQDWDIYRESLAVGGVDGTLARYFKDPRYKGRILGKTGYIRGVRSLSGLCMTDNGQYIFSILANNSNGNTRTVINKIATAIIDEFSASVPEEQ
jgi:D-alanyl-D-alanine carboxypeptidase/D-alanyl-D-alanine-endopeptidase (penicillin-binding protein 4)